MEQIRLSQVVAPSEWITTSNILYDRASLIRDSRDFVFDDDLSVCSHLFDHTNMVPQYRIGSESSEGEVYRVKYTIPRGVMQGYEVLGAFKIMPILTPESAQKNQNEIDLAVKASNLVKKGKSPYFPLVYTAGHCPDVTFYSQSKFTEPSWKYACMTKIYDAYPTKTRRIQALEKQGISIPTMLKQLGDEHLCDQLTIPADFLFSELANEDLYSWGHKRHTVATWKKVLSSVVTGIYHLHFYLKECHNDLHLGNVLIVNDLSPTSRVNLGTPQRSFYMEYTEVPLIHDFGKSVPLTGENKWEGWRGDTGPKPSVSEPAPADRGTSPSQWEDVRHFFDSLSKLAREIHNTYLEELSTRVLNEYVALEDDPATHGVVDWKDYQRLITAIESV